MVDSRLPPVSVVVPAYNAEALVADAVTSALAQTYPLNEIVCVDDGSTDGTLQVLRDLEDTHPEQLTVITGPNRGGSAARNTGMAVTTGDYIQFLDADDMLLPEKIEKDVVIISEAYPPLLFGLHEGVELDGPRYVAPPFKHRDPWLSFAHNRFGHTVANLFRRDAVLRAGGWDEARPFNQEYDLIARMLVDEAHVAFGDHHSTYVRRQPGSISATFTSEMREARIAIDERVRLHLRTQGHREAVEAIEASLFLQVRQLYKLAPERAAEWHERLFGTGYAPPANGSSTTLYRKAYRYLGFARAEALKHLLDRARTLVKP